MKQRVKNLFRINVIIVLFCILAVRLTPLALGENGIIKPTAPDAPSPSISKVQNVAKINYPQKTEAVFDLGYILPKSKHEVKFLIKNTEDASFKIKKIRSQCKCMGIMNRPTELKPNAETELKIYLKAEDKSSYYSKRFLIQTSNKKRPLIIFTLKADIGKPLKFCENNIIEINPAENNQLIEKKLTIENRGNKPIKLIYSTATFNGITAVIPSAAIEPKKKISVPVNIRLDELPKDFKKGLLHIHTGYKLQKQISIPVVCIPETNCVKGINNVLTKK